MQQIHFFWLWCPPCSALKGAAIKNRFTLVQALSSWETVSHVIPVLYQLAHTYWFVAVIETMEEISLTMDLTMDLLSDNLSWLAGTAICRGIADQG
jgi:thiol-disulfide isomerase/thioredoxin